MSCCGGNAGNTGTSGGVARWIMPVLIAAVFAMLLWSVLSGRARSSTGTETPTPARSDPSPRP